MQRKKIILAVLLSLIAGTAMAQQAKVTSLMSKDLKDFPGKEGLLITVEYPPGASDPIHRHNAHAFVYVLEGLHRHAAERRKTSDAHTRGDLLRRPQRCSYRWSEREQHSTSKIPCVLGQGQGRSSARASEVTGERLSRLLRIIVDGALETHRRNELLWFNKHWQRSHTDAP